ncbi:MAG: HAMP domain-containing protein [Treponema sp.]|nr:HAMP domain-containing protein [Treponema sp.]
MKLIWKLAIPQICIVFCFGLISFIVINSSFISIRNQYVYDVIEDHFQFIKNEIKISSQKAVSETAMFVRLPAVIQAYEIALSGDIYDPYSPQSQAARDLLRKELAPMLDSYRDLTGKDLELHFHLPNGFSLVRIWRKLNTKVDGVWVDISDDLSSHRPSVLAVNKTRRPAFGLELGSGGFAIRGVIPIIGPDGRQLGSAEALQQFDPILEAAVEEGKIFIALYANAELLDYSIELQNPDRYPHIGDFVKIIGAKDSYIDSLITPELLSRGKDSSFIENHNLRALAAYPLTDNRGNQVGVIVCAMDTRIISILMRLATMILALMLAGMAAVSVLALFFRLRVLVTNPLNTIKEKIQDIAEDRANLGEQILNNQNDEISELAKSLNTLAAKLAGMMYERQAILGKNYTQSEKFKTMSHWYGSVFDSIPFPISVQDKNMKSTFVNTAFEELFRKKREDVIGLPCNNWEFSICNTGDCAIICAKQGLKQTRFTHEGKSYQVEIEMLRDIKEEITGFIEVIHETTPLEQPDR